MEVLSTLLARNGHFVTSSFNPALKMMPTLKTVIISCLDPRLDPALILGLHQSDAAVLRNVGGRITPDIVDSLSIIHRIAQKAGGRLGPGWNVIILHHNDCGITRVVDTPQLLAKYLGVHAGQLHEHGLLSPQLSVKIDVAALRANKQLPGGYVLSGCVYDVTTGNVETVVQPENVPENQQS